MIFVDQLLHELGSLVRRPTCLRSFAKPDDTSDDIQQIGKQVLKRGVSKHHANEGLRERLRGGHIGVREIAIQLAAK